MKHLRLCLILIVLLFALTLQARNNEEKNDFGLKQQNKRNNFESSNNNEESKNNNGNQKTVNSNNDGENDAQSNSTRRPWSVLKPTDPKVVAALTGTKTSILEKRKLPSTDKIEVKRAFEWKGRLSSKLIAKYRLLFQVTTADGKLEPNNTFCKAIVGQFKDKSYKLFKLYCQ